jgi:hypothetical protein
MPSTVVRYVGATTPQTLWGGNSDPRIWLEPGAVYAVVEIIGTPLVPQFILADYPNQVFNAACFEPVEGGGG